jgi:hypothetical protein
MQPLGRVIHFRQHVAHKAVARTHHSPLIDKPMVSDSLTVVYAPAPPLNCDLCAIDRHDRLGNGRLN